MDRVERTALIESGNTRNSLALGIRRAARKVPVVRLSGSEPDEEDGLSSRDRPLHDLAAVRGSQMSKTRKRPLLRSSGGGPVSLTNSGHNGQRPSARQRHVTDVRGNVSSCSRRVRASTDGVTRCPRCGAVGRHKKWAGSPPLPEGNHRIARREGAQETELCSADRPCYRGDWLLLSL
jgi:hypothetical protein